MTESPATETTEAAPAAPEATRPRRRGRLLLQALNLLALVALVAIYLVYVVEQQREPVYSWIADTPIESLGLELAPLFWRQKHRIAKSAQETPLLLEEGPQSELILKRMDTIRPTHVVVLEGGEQLFGRLRQDRKSDAVMHLTQYEAGKFRARSFAKKKIVMRRPIVFPAESLTAADMRFLLEYADYDHYFLPPYVFVTPAGFGRALEVFRLLNELGTEFRREFASLIDGNAPPPHIHVCLFTNEQDYAHAAGSSSDFRLINSQGFYRKQDNALFLVDRTPAGSRSGDLTQLLPGDNGKAGTVPPDSLFNTNTAMVCRHEGAHQLAAAWRVFSASTAVPFWLEEGLAQYCETSPLGGAGPGRLALLADADEAGALIPWNHVLGLLGSDLTQDPKAEKLAYAQSWMIFRRVMSREYKHLFFKYLLDVRQGAATSPGQDPTLILMNSLGTMPSKFFADLEAAIRASRQVGAGKRVAAP